MRPTLGATFKGAVEGRKHTDGRKLFKAIATTPALDRYGEVVLPKGAMLDNFMKNPVLLEIHNYAKTSVGQVTKIDVTEKEMICEFVFSTCARGQELQTKYEAGDMSAFSIGFDPQNKVRLWFPWDDAPQDLTEVTVDLPDGTKQSVDLRGYDQIPYVIHTKWDLLELSPVPVPANPEAILIRQAHEIVRKAMELDPVTKSFVQEEVEQSLAPALELLEKFNAKFNTDTIKVDGAVPFVSTKGVDVEWNGTEVRLTLAKWASNDGTGSKETINWAKFRKGFGSLEGAVDSFGSYRFLHHTLSEDSLVVVWRGLTAAMAALLEDGDVKGELKQDIYDHLSLHYTDFGKTAPELYAGENSEAKTFTAEELKAIADEPLVAAVVATGEVAQPAASVDASAQIEEAKTIPAEGVSELRLSIEEIRKMLSRMVTEVSEEMISLNLKMSMIEDYLAKKPVKAEKPEVKATKEDEVLFEVAPECLESLAKFVQ